jgi:hypothetical protein
VFFCTSHLNLLISFVSLQNETIVAQRWKAANLSWDDFTDKPDVANEYKNDPELQFLSGNKGTVGPDLKKLVNELCIQIEKDNFVNSPEAIEKYVSLFADVRDQPEIVCALLPHFFANAYEIMHTVKTQSKEQEKGEFSL